MNLVQIVQQYQTESCSFFKSRDAYGNPINQRFSFPSHLHYLGHYLGYYRQLKNFMKVIENAANGFFKLWTHGKEFSIRHNHQEVYCGEDGQWRGVPYDASRAVAEQLKNRAEELNTANDFEAIFDKERFGELAIYDTSVRIGYHKGIEPMAGGYSGGASFQ
jgi:hypothetical protein